MSTRFRLRAVATFVLGVSAAAPGCDAGLYPPPASGEEIGELTLALMTVPSDVDCLRGRLWVADGNNPRLLVLLP